MRKALFLLLFILSTALVHTQPVRKGNVFTLHVLSVDLKKGVSMDAFLDFIADRYIPAVREAFPDVEPVLLEGIRGQQEGNVGYINYYESEEVMHKYFPQPGRSSPDYRTQSKKLNPVLKELSQLGTFRFEGYTT